MSSSEWGWGPPRWFEAVWHCHRLPERCFRWRGRAQWVCARCVGVLAGLALGTLAATAILAVRGFAGWVLPASWAPGAVGMLACLTDWSLQQWAGLASTNPRRLVTGLAGGYGLVTVPCAALAALL